MTMAAVSAICAAIQDVVVAVSGVRAAPDVPPEQIAVSSGVLAACYPGEGEFKLISAEREQGNHIIQLSVFTAQRNMSSDWARMIGLGDTVARALLSNGTLAGTALAINRIRYTFGTVEWGGSAMFGWLFTLEVLTTGSLS